MTKVAVLDDWQDAVRHHADWDRLAGRAEIRFFGDAFAGEDQAASSLADFDILLTMQDRMPLPGSLITRLPKLRMVGTTMSNSVLDMNACADGPGENGAWAPAELALGLLVTAFRSIPQADAAMRRGGFQHGVPVGRTLSGKTLGIIGLGRLGGGWRYAAALGMTVLAWSPDLDDARAAAGARSVTKDALMGYVTERGVIVGRIA